MNTYKSDYISDINKELYAELMNKKYELNKKLTVLSIDNGVVLPPSNPKTNKHKNTSKSLFGSGGVLDSNNKYIEESAQLAYGMKNRIGKTEIYNQDDVEIVHESVVYMNFFIKQWGHFLIDVIGRLWYFIQSHNIKIVYTCYENENYKLDGNYLELLKLLGIKEEQLIRINKSTKFDNIIIPEMSIYPGKYYTKEYKKIFDTIIDNVGILPINKNKKIYCSRMSFGKNNKKEFGEEIIEENLKYNGYDVVYMEKLSLKQQISILNESAYVAMTCGLLSHNLLFIRNNNKVLIFNKTYRSNLHQFMVNEIANSENCFIDVFVSPLPILYGYGPFIIRFTDEFKNLCNDLGYKIINNYNKITFNLKVKYYMCYLISYRKFIFGLKKIRETEIEKYEPSYRTIRNYYKKYLKKCS